ncbi:MAG: urease accessory protein UreD [Pseudomonadota bacterium]
MEDISMQRACGRAALAFDGFDGRNRLRHLHQSGCLKVMLPRNHSDIPDAVLINTAGGLTGGDTLATQVILENGASLRLATQTAERIYKSTGDNAQVNICFDLGEACSLDWLAQETILFQKGRVRRRISANIAEDTSLLLVEPIVLGRLSMGEVVSTGHLHDTWRIFRDDRLIFADDTKIEDFSGLKRSASIGGSPAMASLLLVDPMAEAMAKDIADIDKLNTTEIGVSAWNGMMVMRFVALNPLDLKNTLSTVIETIRGRALPRVWTM